MAQPLTNAIKKSVAMPVARPAFFLRTEETWDAIYADCSNARLFIELQQYILENDKVGQRFMKLFIRKAREGVRVTLILDSVGSRTMVSSPLVEVLRRAGGHVYFFNPLKPWDILRPRIWFPRNHAKVMVIDGSIVHIGSACIAEEMATWHDIHARFENLSLIQSIRQDFHLLLQALEAENFENAHTIPLKADPSFYYCISRPQIGRNPIYEELLKQIRQATRSICLVSPYLLPPRRLYKALKKASRQGVSVTLMISDATDVSLADQVCRSYLPKFLRAGFKILFYKKALLHAKYVIVDDNWAMLGSTNLDYLSLWHNLEANILMEDRPVVAELRSYFDADIKDCRVADMTYWKNLPWTYKLAGYAGRYIEKML